MLKKRTKTSHPKNRLTAYNTFKYCLTSVAAKRSNVSSSECDSTHSQLIVSFCRGMETGKEICVTSLLQNIIQVCRPPHQSGLRVGSVSWEESGLYSLDYTKLSSWWKVTVSWSLILHVRIVYTEKYCAELLKTGCCTKAVSSCATSLADVEFWAKKRSSSFPITGKNKLAPFKKRLVPVFSTKRKHCPAFVLSPAGHRLAPLPPAMWPRASASRVTLWKGSQNA